MIHDINRKYRSMAIYIATKSRHYPLISWSELQEGFGICYETYMHELVVKGLINTCCDYVYLSYRLSCLTPSDIMKEILSVYPYSYLYETD